MKTYRMSLILLKLQYVLIYVCHVVVAAEAGSVVELQKHLDRRKFALSRDRGTAATILHKAVALGHQEVARYSIIGLA
jgi:hypothetical protein